MDTTHGVAPERRVLIVEDDEDIREVTRMALTVVGGWQVSTATGGREALEVARRDAPDAILLDMMMPEMDGPSTIAHLRRDPRTRKIPIILLTAKLKSRDREDWPSQDLAGVITKPFDPMALPGEVSTLLGWPR